jgi:hypothetical protein
MTRAQVRSFVLAALALVVLGWWSPARAGMEIASLDEKAILEPSGTLKVVTTVKITKAEAGPLLVPTGFKRAEEIKVEGLPGATASYSNQGGARAFVITAPAAPTEKDLVKLSFTVPGFYDWKKEKVADFGNRTLEVRFQNTLPTKVQAYSMELMLPPKYVVNTIDDSSPKLTSKSPVPPFKTVHKDGAYGIGIKASKVEIGDSCFLKIRFKEGSRSGVFLAACLGVCVLYLFGFRHLIGVDGRAEQKGPSGVAS